MIKADGLQERVHVLEEIERDLQAKIATLVERDSEWEARTNQLFSEIQQNEIMQEKKDYERSVRMNEMGELLREQ